MEPVVMALRRGMVTVGDVACAVKGRATPSRIKLELASVQVVAAGGGGGGGCAYDCTHSKPLFGEYTKSLLPAISLRTKQQPRHGPVSVLGGYLRSASTTIKTSRSKGGSGGAALPTRGLYSARPWRSGLYGKKPVAKRKMAAGTKMLAATRRSVALSVPLRRDDDDDMAGARPASARENQGSKEIN